MFGRLEEAEATLVVADLHKVARLYVDLFQPSIKLEPKTRKAAMWSRCMIWPATPYKHLHADESVKAGQSSNFE